jgi:hypothetical protein
LIHDAGFDQHGVLREHASAREGLECTEHCPPRLTVGSKVAAAGLGREALVPEIVEAIPEGLGGGRRFDRILENGRHRGAEREREPRRARTKLIRSTGSPTLER